MMSSTNFHTALYRSSIAAGATNAQVTPVADSVLTISGNGFLVPQEADFLASFSIGVDMARTRLNTPKLRNIGLPSLTPINQGATVPSPPNVYDGIDYPLRLAKVDSTIVESTNTGAGAENHSVVVWLGFGPRRLSAGPVFRLRGTAAITVAAGSWANGTITLDNSLMNGRYEIVGLDVVGTNLLAARLIFPGASFRPGILCRNAVTSVPYAPFPDRRLGSFGQFEMPNLPNLECCSLGANTSQEVFLDVVRLGDA